jgi:hypothetical protein
MAVSMSTVFTEAILEWVEVKCRKNSGEEYCACGYCVPAEEVYILNNSRNKLSITLGPICIARFRIFKDKGVLAAIKRDYDKLKVDISHKISPAIAAILEDLSLMYSDERAELGKDGNPSECMQDSVRYAVMKKINKSNIFDDAPNEYDSDIDDAYDSDTACSHATDSDMCSHYTISDDDEE